MSQCRGPAVDGSITRSRRADASSVVPQGSGRGPTTPRRGDPTITVPARSRRRGGHLSATGPCCTSGRAQRPIERIGYGSLAASAAAVTLVARDASCRFRQRDWSGIVAPPDAVSCRCRRVRSWNLGTAAGRGVRPLLPRWPVWSGRPTSTQRCRARRRIVMFTTGTARTTRTVRSSPLKLYTRIVSTRSTRSADRHPTLRTWHPVPVGAYVVQPGVATRSPPVTATCSRRSRPAREDGVENVDIDAATVGPLIEFDPLNGTVWDLRHTRVHDPAGR